MYEAADILDLCHLKAMERGPSKADCGCFNPLLFCMRNPSHARDIGTRIKALNKRLDTIKERSAAFSFINLGSYEDRVHAARSSDARRETSGEFDRSGVVGEKIEQDTRKLVDMMLTEKESNNNIIVFAVVGVGGIGKTTLAQKIFNDETMKAEFDKTIWLSINKDFDKIELLRTIITQAGGVHGGEKALAVLQPILATALKGKRLFLVLDDVWNHGAWGDVLKTPLANVVARGSRVLVTTRDEKVVRAMKAVLPYHHVDKLEEEDAWSLLKKQDTLFFLGYSHLTRKKTSQNPRQSSIGDTPQLQSLLMKAARFKETWKYLQGETSCPVNQKTIVATIHACCYLHNMVIDMEDGAAMPSVEKPDYSGELRQLANEHAVMARDMLAQYFLTTMSSKSGVGPVDVEEDHEVAATCLGDENKEQEAETTAAEEERQC
ncbi:hypothetical protein ZWY2020_015793 [Hordeum vulgare]|nr:hypothetical protein ZWY2020_015793 [Hordeum vulgare]